MIFILCGPSDPNVVACRDDGELALLHGNSHGPDAVREPALDGGERGLCRGPGLVDFVEPARVFLPQFDHLGPGVGPLAGMVLLGLKVRAPALGRGRLAVCRGAVGAVPQGGAASLGYLGAELPKRCSIGAVPVGHHRGQHLAVRRDRGVALARVGHPPSPWRGQPGRTG